MANSLIFVITGASDAEKNQIDSDITAFLAGSDEHIVLHIPDPKVTVDVYNLDRTTNVATKAS